MKILKYNNLTINFKLNIKFQVYLHKINIRETFIVKQFQKFINLDVFFQILLSYFLRFQIFIHLDFSFGNIIFIWNHDILNTNIEIQCNHIFCDPKFYYFVI